MAFMLDAMTSAMQAKTAEWQMQRRDDTPHVTAAMREWNFKQAAWKPFLKFSDIPAAEQSRVLIRAAELARASQGR